MEWRNAKLTQDGSINVEVLHPIYGWIPFTARADDPEAHGRALFAEVAASGQVAPADEPTQTPLEAWREQAYLTRMQFCLALKALGVLTAAEAVAAAKGDLPAIFAATLAASDIDPDDAAIIWAAAQVIERLHPLILLAQQTVGWADAQVDALFGWEG